MGAGLILGPQMVETTTHPLSSEYMPLDGLHGWVDLGSVFCVCIVLLSGLSDQVGLLAILHNPVGSLAGLAITLGQTSL